MSAQAALRIDPFARSDSGVYRDELVEVEAIRGVRPRRSLHMVRTPHFDLTHDGPRVRVSHTLAPVGVDDDLSGLLADELFTSGWLRGPELFERLFTGVVLTSMADPLACWELFYRNTLDRIAESLDGVPGSAHGTIADYAPVYAAAERALGPGSVLELGSCFGFLSLRLAAAGRVVTASDLSAGTVDLLRAVAPRLRVPLSTQVAEAARFPAPDGCADNVLLIHLLEHLEPEHGDRVVLEAVRLARRRVVIAVPFEEVADETWGHVRTVTRADLERWGERSGLAHTVREDHGGWLTLDHR